MCNTIHATFWDARVVLDSSAVVTNMNVTIGVRSCRIVRIIGFQISLHNYSAVLQKEKMKMQQKKLDAT
jgi:hypothetical protein